MTHTMLTIDGRRFPILHLTGTDLKTQILNLFQAGGGFLTVPTSTGVTDVRITPVTAVTVDQSTDEDTEYGLPANDCIFPRFDDYDV